MKEFAKKYRLKENIVKMKMDVIVRFKERGRKEKQRSKGNEGKLQAD
jgi:hypothetical protein